VAAEKSSIDGFLRLEASHWPGSGIGVIPKDLRPFIDLAKQQPAGIGCDPPATEIRYNPARSEALKLQLLGDKG
jgi:hypothetical protein